MDQASCERGTCSTVTMIDRGLRPLNVGYILVDLLEKSLRI